jgi:hypothetical protein
MQTLIQTAVLNPIQTVMARVVSVLPSVLWAMALVIIGALLARLLRKGLEKILALGQIDAWCDKVELNTLLSHLGLGRSPTKVVSVLLWWFVFLVFFVGAANALGLNIVSEVLNRLAFFLPQVIAAVFVLGAGVFVSTAVRDIVLNACTANRVKGGPTVAKLARGAVVGFASFMALEQLGIARTITTSTLQIILASIGLAFALAFGLGGRDAAADIISHLRGKD